MRYRLRTLLIVITVACLLFALLSRYRVVGSATLNGSQVVVCKASPLGGIGLSSTNQTVTATFSTLTVVVDAKQVRVVGARTVPLPASWSRIELIQSGNGVQMLLDGVRFPDENRSAALD